MRDSMKGKNVTLLLLLLLAGIHGCASLPPPGTSSEKWPHLHAAGDGTWYPAPGYTWTHRDSNGKPIPGKMEVQWTPGVKYYYLGSIKWPHIIASNTEGRYVPEEGYTWLHPGVPGDLAVQVKPAPPAHPEPSTPIVQPTSVAQTVRAVDVSDSCRHYRYVVEGDRPLQCRKAGWYDLELTGWVFISYSSGSEAALGGSGYMKCDPINAGRTTDLTARWTDHALEHITHIG
jgi:hypothetical protein